MFLRYGKHSCGSESQFAQDNEVMKAMQVEIPRERNRRVHFASVVSISLDGK